jgi:hypothetical protein
VVDSKAQQPLHSPLMRARSSHGRQPRSRPVVVDRLRRRLG